MVNLLLDISVWLPYNMAMKMKNKDDNISHAVLDLAEEYIAQERKTRFYGTDTPIHYSEIHTLMFVVRYPGIHVLGLAERLEITKASASEIVQKIEKKGLIEKRVGEDKKSKLAIFPTEKGIAAHENHMKYHDAFNRMVEGQLMQSSPSDKEAILVFLKGISACLREHDILEEAQRGK